MNPFLSNSEEALEELKELLYFAPPNIIRDHLMEVYFTYLIEVKPCDYPSNHTDITESIYFLYNFLNKLDNIISKH